MDYELVGLIFFNLRPMLQASSVGGKKHSVLTDYILKVLDLDICSQTLVGSDMVRGVSGGQRKRVTSGLFTFEQINNNLFTESYCY